MSDPLLERLKLFVEEIYKYRVPEGGLEEGAMPFGVVDYYGMEALLADIDHELKKHDA